MAGVGGGVDPIRAEPLNDESVWAIVTDYPKWDYGWRSLA